MVNGGTGVYVKEIVDGTMKRERGNVLKGKRRQMWQNVQSWVYMKRTAHVITPTDRA